MEFDFANIAGQDAYKLMISTVVPRPIALVTTTDQNGVVNAAPFSFFNVLGANPPIVALGLDTHPEKVFKDTSANIRQSGEFVIHIVNNRIAEQMNICATDFGSEVNELEEAGLTTLPSVKVTPPRIAEAPVAMECKRLVTLEFGAAHNIVMGQVHYMHISDDLVIDADKHYIDVGKLDAVGRLNAAAYARITDRFEMPRMSVEEWRVKKE